MDYKLNLLKHAMAIQQLMPGLNARAEINLADLSLVVRARARRFRLVPQFYIVDNSGARYWPEHEGKAMGFIGWLPYFNKRWPVAISKFAFKEFCAANELPTPEHSRASTKGMRGYVVKKDQSSFGRGLRGPFRDRQQGGIAPALTESEYYEEFVAGRILKAWYWDERLLALEVLDPPKVKGDGASTVRQLIEKSLRVGPGDPPWEHYGYCVSFHGATLETVLEAGREVVADFLYGSRLLPFQVRNTSRLAEFQEKEIGRQLASMGTSFLRAVPPELRGAGTMYTVDAMADERDKVWLLEMNCNPSVHPDAYRGMFEALFGGIESIAPPPAEPLPAPAMLPLPAPAAGLARPWRYS